MHAEGVRKEKLGGLADHGESSPELRKSIHNFIGSFWVNFGRAKAKQMAEDRRAEVIAQTLLLPCLLLVG